jgi:homoserine O-acetyltransferase
MSASPPALSGRAQRVPLPSPFRLTTGGLLKDAHLAVETYGQLNSARDNAILLFTGLSASAHAASHPADPSPGWWEAMIGPGKALDTDRWFVVCANSLGSCFGSTGPSTPDPTTGAAYGAAFPELRVEDIARASQAAVEALGIDTLAATVGTSLGGMTVLAHAALFPGRARALVSISGAMAASASAIATRSLQREIVALALRPGTATESIENAMKIARKIGVISYIGADLLEKRFGRTQNEPYAGRGSGTDFEVEGWLEHLAQKFARQFDPWSYWTLSRAMDLYDFGDPHGPQAAAAGLNLERALVIGVREDTLFRIDQQETLASVLAGAGIPTEYIKLSSPYGHDAFLTEVELFTPVLRTFLNGAKATATNAVQRETLRPH